MINSPLFHLYNRSKGGVVFFTNKNETKKNDDKRKLIELRTSSFLAFSSFRR